MEAPRPGIIDFLVADRPEPWRAAGFHVGTDATVRVGRTTIVLTEEPDPPGGIKSWTLRGVRGEADLDGIVTRFCPDQDDPEPEPPRSHPNSAVRIDHVVILSPDRERTVEAFARHGLEPRRTRRVVGPEPMLQTFFRLGEVIAEVITPEEPSDDARPAKLFGLAYEVADLPGAAEILGESLGSIRDAVQPGRQIATLRHRQLGVSVPTAFMSA